MIREIEKKTRKPRRREASYDEIMSDPKAPFGKKLAALRTNRGLTQDVVATEVSRECALLFGREAISNRAVSKWERGDSLPDAQQFLCLLKLYGVSDALFTFRGIPSAADPFLALNKLGRERANEYIGMLSENPYFSAQAKKERVYRQIPLYDLPASAGTGVFLDGDSYTMIDADETVPDAANLAVRISGDSMTPLFSDGQVVYVRQQQELMNGDIGIFVLNGDAYCKRFENEDGVRLVSLNPKYPPIAIDGSCELRVVGKVVG